MGNHDPKAWEQGGERKSAGDMKFVSLHHHTTFSYLDGFGTPEQHNERAAQLGMKALAATEHGNVTSHVQHEKAADKYGVKPIFGCEVYTGGVGEDDRTQKKNHLTVLAENEVGYKNLLELVSRGWAEGYYYEPTVSGAMLREHADGLIVTSGCSGSLLATSLTGGKNVAPEDASMARARAVAKKFKGLLGDSYFLEVQAFPELQKTKDINTGYVALSQELGIPMVATLDAHYTQPTEGEMQRILHNVRGGNRKSLEDLEREWGYNIPLCPLTDADIVTRLVGTGLTRRQAEAAVAVAADIGERCNVRLPKVENLKYPLPPEAESDEWLFRRWINDGWKYRGFDKLTGEERRRYMDRVKYEMDMIQSKGFIDYFLFVSDVVRWAKDSAIPVGPARGSAAASIVCYLLRITEINPLLFPTLLFERFIDLNRHDLPDIDLDFDDAQRWKVREYLAEKYGADHVGNIGTFTKYKGKNSLDDIQRSVYPDNWDCKRDVETVKGLLIERSSGDLRADGTIEDSAEMFPQVAEILERWPDLRKAALLEGNVKGMSVHAAGLVVANGRLTDACAVYTRVDANGKVKLDEETGEPMQVVSVDKHDAEYLNVMKLDALGLKTMGMIDICLNLLGMTLPQLYDVPLDDPETMRGFKENDVVGVFQFDGRAMRSVNRNVSPDNFTEVCDINALARPGPLHSGATAEYADIKHGRSKAVHYHPIIDDITHFTQYQIVYQEQILQTVRLLGDFSWEEASRIRKIISKKRGQQEFNSMRAKFAKGAAKHGMSASDADKVFSMLATAGAYAFNAAHCVSYGMLAWWTMWLKRNHPAEFYVASLAKCNEGDKKGRARRDQLLRDADKHGIKIGKLKPNQSQLTWSIPEPGEPVIIPGFRQVKGIGEKTAQAILDYREENGDFDSWKSFQKVGGVGPATAQALEDFYNDRDPFGLLVLTETLARVKAAIQGGIEAEDHTGEHWFLPAPTHTAAQVPYEKTKTNIEVIWLGVVRDRNLKDIFELHHSKTGEHLDPKDVKDAHLNEYVVLTCEDDTDLLAVTVDRWHYQALKEKVWEITPDKDLVLVRGHKKGFQDRRAIYIHDIWVFDLDDEPEEELDDDRE
jgi:DNA polymerase-3 subunit alpha